jgi:hypothetical protein
MLMPFNRPREILWHRKVYGAKNKNAGDILWTAERYFIELGAS